MMHTQVQAKMQTKLMRHKQDKRICYCHHEMISDAKFMYKNSYEDRRNELRTNSTNGNDWRKKCRQSRGNAAVDCIAGE